MPEVHFVWQRHLIRNNSFFADIRLCSTYFSECNHIFQPVVTWITTTTSRPYFTRNIGKQRLANLLDSSDLNSTPEHNQQEQSTSSFNQQTSSFFSVAELLNSELKKTEKPQLDNSTNLISTADDFNLDSQLDKLAHSPRHSLGLS